MWNPKLAKSVYPFRRHNATGRQAGTHTHNFFYGSGVKNIDFFYIFTFVSGSSLKTIQLKAVNIFFAKQKTLKNSL